MFDSYQLGIVLVSHIVRSWYEAFTGDQLQAEVASLRVEVHRARELLSGYNSVLEACERESAWLRLANRTIASFNLLLGLVLLVLWCIYIGRGRRRGSIESADSSLPLTQSAGVRSGPVRPSDLVRLTSGSR